MKRDILCVIVTGCLAACAAEPPITDDNSAIIAMPLVRSAIVNESGSYGTGIALSLSSDGNTALVGSALDVAYVFVRTGTSWQLQATLTGPVGSHFGMAVSLSSDGNTALIGASDEKVPQDLCGAAYVFRRTGTAWAQQARLQTSSPRQFDFFGRSVALSGDGTTAVVGAFLGDVGFTTDQGYADVFVSSGTSWTRQAQLTHATQAGTWFGYALGIAANGNTVIVGAPHKDAESGSAFVFVRSGTTWAKQIELFDSLFLDHYGSSVAIAADGLTAIVGAPQENNGTNIDHGAAFVYGRSGASWTLQSKLVASDATELAQFGDSVALAADGRTAIVGATKADVDFNEGAAYVFARPATTWAQTRRLIAGNGAFNDAFGFATAVSADGNLIAVGGYAALADHRGAMYVYAPGADADADLIPDAEDNCAAVPNSNQANHDTDANGDACDTDDDNDGDLDTADNCPIDANSNQLDTDADQQGNACDFDDDNDNVFDAQDNCPLIVNANQANLDGDAEGDACDLDDDGDTVADTADNCPRAANLDQLNADGDATGDACDPDDDNDGVADASDNCQFVANPDQGDADGNGVGNVCDGDLDGDNVKDPTDNCPDARNPDQLDGDQDGKGNVCDDDDDNDAVADTRDNCAAIPNPDQANADGDASGDACDADDDGDAVADTSDNCPLDANADQADGDRDGVGDLCDPDGDGSGGEGGGCAATRPGGNLLGAGLAIGLAALCRRRKRR